MPVHYSDFCEMFLEGVLRELEVTDAQYERAETAYNSIGDWLKRENSELFNRSPEIYVQGSFRLGTAIRPIVEEDALDIDLVCEIAGSKAKHTQHDIKSDVGTEVKSYADAHGVSLDEPGKRCWTLLYADSRKFHMDVLPAIPDGGMRKALLKRQGFAAQWSDPAIAITDTEDRNYNTISDQWPHSNPKGYSEWFKYRGGELFRSRRQELFEKTRQSADGRYGTVEDIPQNRVKTPLQGAIQLLKRHRDCMFQNRVDEKPISIIISTLSAHSYEQEDRLTVALFAMLSRMDRFIEDREGVAWIPNPVDPLENFADKWEEHPQLEECFYEWLEAARDDFDYLAQSSSPSAISGDFAQKLGTRAVGSTLHNLLSHRKSPVQLQNAPVDIRPVPAQITSAPHKQVPPWSDYSGDIGRVEIAWARAGRSYWRSSKIRSNDEPIPKDYSLRFKAKTTVPKPYQVFWQVVNTGVEAASFGAKGLRGGLDDVRTEEGGLLRKESTEYRGSHSIECFIVKDGRLAARSGPFIVNIY